MLLLHLQIAYLQPQLNYNSAHKRLHLYYILGIKIKKMSGLTLIFSIKEHNVQDQPAFYVKEMGKLTIQALNFFGECSVLTNS